MKTMARRIKLEDPNEHLEVGDCYQCGETDHLTTLLIHETGEELPVCESCFMFFIGTKRYSPNNSDPEIDFGNYVKSVT
jgi:hypothetical protein